MSATTLWEPLDTIRNLGIVPPDQEQDPEKRLKAQVDFPGPDADPPPLVQVLIAAIITLVVRSAPVEFRTPAYAALEEGALDRIMDDLEQSILREVHSVVVAA